MRTKLLKTMMPFAVLMFAVVAAFATQAKEVSSSTLVDAYIPIGPGQPCEDTQIQCETVDTNEICTTELGQIAFGLADPQDKTSCIVDLYMPRN